MSCVHDRSWWDRRTTDQTRTRFASFISYSSCFTNHGESRRSLVRLFTIYVAPGTMLHTMISHQHHTGDYWSNLVCPQAIYFLISLSRSPVSARFNPARGMHSLEHSGVERGKDQNTSSLARSIAQRKITLWTDCRSNRISAASVS